MSQYFETYTQSESYIIYYVINTFRYYNGMLRPLLGDICSVAELDKVLVGELNEWVANPLGPAQTSALNSLKFEEIPFMKNCGTTLERGRN